MTKRPPHILVTTPESLYLLLTSEGGRKMMATVRTVIVDEIHAVVRDKRGSHLALSLERLESLAGHPVQRIGLSATQKPLDEVGRLPGRRGPRVRAGGRGHVPHPGPGDRDPSFAPLHRVLPRAVGGDLRAHGRPRARAPHQPGLREHPQDGRAHRRPAHAPAGRGRGQQPPRQPVPRAPAGGRGAAEVRAAAGPGGHGLAGAGHRHRRRGPGDAGGRHPLHRHLPPAGGPRRARPGPRPEGPAVPPHPRRAGRGRGAPALRAAGDPGPHSPAAPAPGHPGPAGGGRLRGPALGRAGAVRDLPPRLALPRPGARGVRPGGGAAHRRAAGPCSIATASTAG